MMIVNDDARIVNKLDASLTDNARVIIYDRHRFIVQATDCCAITDVKQWQLVKKYKICRPSQ